MKHIFLIFILCVSSLVGWEPLAVYTLLEDRPDTKMAIQWVSEDEKGNGPLLFAEEGSPDWFAVVGTRKVISLPQTYYVHRIVLTELKPDTTYHFKLNNSEKDYRFHTLPSALNRPVTFVDGGDIYHDTIDYVRNMNKMVAALKPDFVILGGDIAYTDSRFSFLPEKLLLWSQELLSKMHLGKNKKMRWIEWLRAWSDDMVTPEGLLIPMVAVIGNHDVNGGFNQNKEVAKNFYTLFMGDSPTVYRTVDIGKDLSIIVLDSGHTAPIGGEQTTWLYNTLNDRKSVLRKFATYHVPAYPSVRDIRYKQSTLVRRHWVPFFEIFGINAAFEHHDHAYKRTVPIRNGKEDPEGVLYFGDGAWGVKSVRKPKTDRWYLAHAEKRRNIIHVKVDKNKISYSAFDEEGVQFDHLEK